MTSINLYQDKQQETKQLSSRTANGGFFFSLAILVVTLLVLVGLKISVGVLEKKNQALETAIGQENAGLAGQANIDKVTDLQTRLDQIKSNLQIKNNGVSRLSMNVVLDNLGASMSSSAVVTSYKLENKKVYVTFNVNSFDDASKQILNFKKSDFFTNVNLENIIRGEKGINTEVSMDIK